MRTSKRCRIAGALVFAILHIGAPGIAARAEADGRQELVILNWADYLDPDVVAEFEASHNARIRQVIFETDEARDQKLVDSDGSAYDLAVVNDVMVSPYRNRGWLAPLNELSAPNLRNIAPRWRDVYPAAMGYAAPYTWGTLGIAYRADLVPARLTSWKQFFEPGEALKNKITMTGDSADTIGMALKALGFSANSIDPRELAVAESLLLKQKPYVQSFDYIDLSETSPLVSGTVVASMMYSGDALTVADFDANIKYVVPEEGGNLWVDYLVVLDKSNSKKMALAFVNFLNEPEIAARVAQYAYCASPNPAAEKFLPADFLANPVIYPPADVLARSEVLQALPPRAEKRRSAIYARLVY